MKNFKKLLLLIFVAVFAIVLIGCGEKSNPDKDKLNEMADKIYLGNTEEIVGDMTLPKYAFGNKEFSITWESSDTSVIEVKEGDETSYLGSVTLADEAKNVTLTATVKYKDLSTTRKFEITVLADEYEGYENIAAVKAKDGKEKDVSKVKFSGTVSFTTKSGFGVSDGSASIYCYQSNHGRTVGEEVEVRGVWTYYNNMVQIASGCVVKLLGTDADFDIANLAEEKTVSEIFDNKAVETVDPVNCTKIYKTTFVAKNSTGDYNKYCLADPTDNSKYIDLSKYNDSETIDYVGGLVEEGKFYEGIVIIYCSRSAGAAGLWDVLLVPSTVKEVEVKLTDAQIVSGILNDLNTLNGKKVKADLELPTTHTSGATISWVSDKEDVISAAGVYTAPNANTEVKLTATVVLNNETQTIEITVMAAGKVKTVANLVTNPVAGVAYKLGIDQQELGQKLFATGAMSSYYGATITEHADAIDVYLEEVEGGYNVYTIIGGAKKYIVAVVSGTYKNFKYEDAPATPWTYNTEYNTIITTVDEFELFIGTRGTYNTISAYETSGIAAAYPVHFYVEEEVKPYATSPVVGTAYKLGIDQQKVEKILYATGAMDKYYGATTEVYSEAIDVFFEETEGGYYVYTTIEGAKKYISAVVDGTYKNFKYLDEPSNVWVFNSEYNTVTTTVGDFELFMGTRGSYNTISVYETKEIADDFPVHFYTMDPNAGAEDPNPEPDPEPVVEEYVKEVEVGKAYKFFIEQGNKNVTLYFAGTMNGYYGATTETRSEGVDVFFEVNGEGYSLYFMVEGVKKYIVATSSEKDGKTYRNFTIADEASTVWTFDTTHYTLTTIVAEENCYMGTYDQNVTFGVSKMSYISTSFPARFALAEGGSVTPDPDPEPTPEVIDATVTEVLEAAKDLADGQTLKDKYTTSGTVTEITSAYNAGNKNISFKLSDGTNEILCYKVVGDEAVNVKVGDTITLTGDIKNYKGTIEFVNSTIIERKAGEVTPDPDPEPNPNVNSETLEIYANTGKFDADAKKITWEGENFVFLNEQGSNNNAIRTQDADHFRVYQGNITTLSSKNGAAFTKIVITTTGSSYATKLVESEFSAGATATADDKVVTIVVEEGVTEVVITASAQWRLDKVEFVVGDEEVTPDPDPEPTPDPEPVVDEYVKEVEAGKAYKFFIDQTNTSKTLYFAGTMSGNFGAATETKENGVDMYFEAVEGGYNVYFTLEGVKTYFNAVVSGKYVNISLTETASTVWTFDTTNYALTTVIDGTTYYVGTYSTFNTFSISNISYISTSFPARFVLVETEVEEPETPVVPDEPEDEYVGPFENEIPGFEPGYVMKEGTITEVLEAVAALNDGETSNYKYKVTGTVKSITEAYSTQYKNVSFMLENGESSILCFRYKGEDASQIAVGDTITLVGLVKNYKGTLEFVDFTITERVAAPVEPEEPETPVVPDEPETQSETLAVLGTTGTLADDKNSILWKGENFTFLTEKNTSSTAIRTSDSNHFRVYQGTKTTVSATNEKKITKIVITVTESKYATALANSISTSGVTASIAGTVVTLTVDSGSLESIVITATAQWRLSKIEVYYE